MNTLAIQYRLRESNSASQVLTKNVSVLVAELAPVGHSSSINTSELRLFKRRRIEDDNEENEAEQRADDYCDKSSEMTVSSSSPPPPSSLPSAHLLESCTPSITTANGKRYVIGIALRELVNGPFGLEAGYAQYILNRIIREDGQAFLGILCRHSESVLVAAADNVALARSLLFPKCCVSASFHDGGPPAPTLEDNSTGGTSSNKELVFIPLCLVPLFISRGPKWMRTPDAASLLVDQAVTVLETMKQALSEIDYQTQMNLIHSVKQIIQGSFISIPEQQQQPPSPVDDSCLIECDDDTDGYVVSPGMRRLQSVAEIYIPPNESLSTTELYAKYFGGRVPEIKHAPHSATAQQIMGLVQVMIKHQNPAGLIKCTQLPIAARNFIFNLRKLCPNLMVYVQLEPNTEESGGRNNSLSPRKFTPKKQKTTTQMDSTCPSSSSPPPSSLSC